MQYKYFNVRTDKYICYSKHKRKSGEIKKEKSVSQSSEIKLAVTESAMEEKDKKHGNDKPRKVEDLPKKVPSFPPVKPASKPKAVKSDFAKKYGKTPISPKLCKANFP